MIHKTAIVDTSATLGKNISIGPYSIIGPKVEIGDNSCIGPNVVIKGPCRMGRENKIFQFSSIGEDPQDLKYTGEETWLEIGDNNIIREFCTLHRGTIQDKGYTKIGSNNLFMAYVHIAHDCEVGNNTIFANNASLAGHVKVDNFAIMGGFSGVFQFCRLGAYSFAAANSVIIKDVPPFVKVSGYFAKPYGLNLIGLQRQGFTREKIKNIKDAYKIIYRQGLTLAKAIEEASKIKSDEVFDFLKFIQSSNAGIVR